MISRSVRKREMQIAMHSGHNPAEAGPAFCIGGGHGPDAVGLLDAVFMLLGRVREYLVV